mgnify:CR=1 FL=1
MIPEIISQWEERKHLLGEYFMIQLEEIPDVFSVSYLDILALTFKYVITGSISTYHDATWTAHRIISINDDNYEGTLILIIPPDDNAPLIEDYLITTVEYGSQDALQEATGVSDYMEIAFGMVKKLKPLYSHAY